MYKQDIVHLYKVSIRKKKFFSLVGEKGGNAEGESPGHRRESAAVVGGSNSIAYAGGLGAEPPGAGQRDGV
jgi:hypothetical protein